MLLLTTLQYLTTTGTIEYLENPGGAENQAVTGTIDGAALNNGVIILNNGSTTTFANAIGDSQPIKTLTMTTAGIFNSNVSSLAITSTQSKVNQFKGDLTVGATKYIITGNAGEAMFNGAGDQTVTGEIVGAGAEQGIIDNANTAGTVTFASAQGTVELKEVELDASTTTVFNNTVKSALIDVAGKVTLKENDNVANKLTLAAGGTIIIDDTITDGEEVFTAAASQVDDDIAGTGNIKMPANLLNGETITLIAGTTDDEDENILAEVNTAVFDTALRTYTATITAAEDNNDIVITAADNSATTVASNLGTTKNMGTALIQAGIAVETDATALDAF